MIYCVERETKLQQDTSRVTPGAIWEEIFHPQLTLCGSEMNHPAEPSLIPDPQSHGADGWVDGWMDG